MQTKFELNLYEKSNCGSRGTPTWMHDWDAIYFHTLNPPKNILKVGRSNLVVC